MEIEDLSTYTEVDPNSDLTIASSKCDISMMASNIDAYLRADKGAGHFGDFEHLVTSEFTSSSGSTWPLNVFWALTSSAGVVSLVDMDVANEGLRAYSIWTGSVTQWVLVDDTNGNYDIWTSTAFATPYYIAIERSGTTMTCKIYSDSGRTTLLDTLSITCGTDLYRYIFATMGHGTTAGGRSYTGYVEDLDLQEVVVSEALLANFFIPRLLRSVVVARSVYEGSGQGKLFVKDNNGTKIVH